MQLSGQPPKIELPLANDPTARAAIPATTPAGPGRATQLEGFPALTRTDPLAGGVPPDGLDMNGMLYLVSAVTRWLTAGGGFQYDATFAGSTNVAGYPKGATLLNAAGTGYWVNLVDGNTSNPDTGGAGWARTYATGSPATSIAIPFLDGTTARELILQWGTTVIATTPVSTPGAVTLPVTFPNAYINGLCTATDVGANGTGCRALADVGTLNQFRFNHSAPTSFNTTVRWICWGY